MAVPNVTSAITLESVASVATALSVVVAAWQFYRSMQQTQSRFEDSLNTQYRQMLVELPLNALLGRRLTDDELQRYLPAFYRYFDFSNEQAFLAYRERIRDTTWINWREGIEQNMSRPAFWQAWEVLLPDLDGSFDDMKRVLKNAEKAKRFRRPLPSNRD